MRRKKSNQLENIVYQAMLQLNEMRQREPARDVLEKATLVLERFRPDLGSDHRIVASLLRLIAALLEDVGAYESSVGRAAEAIDILRRHGPDAHDELADALTEMATTLVSMGRYPEAERAFTEAVGVYEKTRGEDDVDAARALNGLAAVQRHLGRYAEAEALLHRVADILRRVAGPRSSDYGVVIGNLGEVRHMVNDFAGSESMYRESLEILEESLGPDDPRVGFALDNLAMLLQDVGRYAEALPLGKRGLGIVQAAYGDEHPDVAFSLSNLGAIYREIGDLRQAERLHLQALAIRRKTLGEIHPDTAISYGNLGSLYDALGELDKALPMYESCLDIRRQVYGDVHPEVANALNNLATFLRDRGDLETARKLLDAALDIELRTRGENTDRVAVILSNLAGMDARAGDVERAEERSRRSIRIMRSVLGPEHRDLAGEIGFLAILLAGTGRDPEAMDLLREMVAIQNHQIGQLFGMGSERQRARAAGYYEKGLYGFVSFVLRSYPDDPPAVRSALDLVLQRKALGAEALAVQRDSVLSGRHPELGHRLEELTALRSRIARKALEGPGPEGIEEHQRMLEGWERDKEMAEEELARSIPEMSLDRRLREADHVAVAAALPEGSALVEFVRFNPYDFDAMGRANATGWLPARYAAFVVPAGQSGEVTLVDLGEAEPIDRAIAVVRELITGEAEDPSRAGGHADAPLAGPPTAIEELRAAVFDTLRAAIGERTRLFLAPDGDLTRLPFEVLPTGGKRLIDEYVLSYLSTGRDVIRFGAPTEAAGHPLVAAAPDFDLGDPPSAASAPPPGRRSRDLDPASLHFDPLAGTKDEGREIGKLLGTSPWLGNAVLEGPLKASRSPRILHLATHGFFLPDQAQDPTREPPGLIEAAGERGRLRGTGMENPLLRSGLALAGANTFLRNGPLPPDAEDGILTAEDVSGLDLLGTELVVLSACETGLGEVRVGEGVFGLRRAFVLAGAKTLVMSLWKVPDIQSAELMQAFYRNLTKGLPRAEALREAQLEVARRYPHPWFWGAFICQGDPRPLTLSEQMA